MSTNNEKAKLETPKEDTAKPDVAKDRDYAQVVQENEKLKVRIDRLEAQLRQDNTLLQRVNDVKKAEDEADKERLIIDIMNNSQYTKDVLTPKTIEDLKTIADALEHTEKHFASVTADAEYTRKLREPKLTVGEWDSDKKQWKGGR
jgi:cell division septum initiation protein DivIVA